MGNNRKKRYSLFITISIFIILLSTITISFVILDGKNEMKNREQIDYNMIKKINPLVIEKANAEENKTSSNIELVEEIKRVYGIDVVYGDGTEYIAKTVNSKTIYDPKEINLMLIELISCLELYPNNLLKEIQLRDYTVEICLINYFLNNNIALATRDSNNNFKIYLSNTEKIEKVKHSVHHEMYHILEYYMKLEFDISNLYNDWEKINPQHFSYISNLALLDSKYVYGYEQGEGAYFVSTYSKSSDKEDRAEVFADTMTAVKKPLYYTDDVGAIKSKMELLINILRGSFQSVKYEANITWEKYLIE
ncbi:MAG: hypothetical protein PHE29_11185 [Tissierellia bacterium]|nr:hypothetical protein [Tissierellia bacterium]